MDLSKLAGVTPTIRRIRAYFIHKETGKISYFTCYKEHELVLAVANRGADFSYISNDAGLLIKVTPLPSTDKGKTA